jgi:hypothetical protein
VEATEVRRKLAEAVRKRFTARLNERLPQFQALRSDEIAPGGRLYGWELSPELSAYLLLVLFPHDDWFTLEVAWSDKKRFPIQAPPSLPHEEARGGELRFRAHTLWTDPRTDFWWKLDEAVLTDALELFEQPAEALLARVPACVDDAVGHVVEHVVPYLQRLAPSSTNLSQGNSR